MAMQQADKLVTVAELVKRTGIPRYAIYRLIRRGTIPYTDVTQDWHEVRQYRFDVEAVQAAIAARREQRAS
jgi:excisionase family DNA binding protein